jgi:hypothetical protein
MKFIALIFSMAFALNANASLLSFESDQSDYNTGDLVTVEVFVNDINPAIEFLDAEYTFNDAELEYNLGSFLVTDDVFDNSFFDLDDLIGNSVFLTVEFAPDYTDFLGTSFKLGEITFNALADSVSAGLELASVLAEDGFGDIIEGSDLQVSVSVPAPATLALFPLVAALMFMRRRRNS